MDTIFFFRICSAFSSNDWKNALQHLKTQHLAPSQHAFKLHLQFKQMLAQQIEISFIYTRFLIFLLFYLQSDSSASQGHLQRPQGFNSSAYFSSQLFAHCIPETQILQLRIKLLRENSQLPIRKMQKEQENYCHYYYYLYIHMTLKDLSSSVSDGTCELPSPENCQGISAIYNVYNIMFHPATKYVHNSVLQCSICHFCEMCLHFDICFKVCYTWNNPSLRI